MKLKETIEAVRESLEATITNVGTNMVLTEEIGLGDMGGIVQKTKITVDGSGEAILEFIPKEPVHFIKIRGVIG